LWDRRLALLLALALLAGALAYQAPAATDIAVGWLGDRLFLRASEGAGAADASSFYGDELSPDARSLRSRWTRQEATVGLAGLGAGGDLTLVLRAQGWPADALNRDTRQPLVTVEANGRSIGQFTPSGAWADYPFTIPASARGADSLVLTLRASDTFTRTAAYADDRPKGLRLERVDVREGAPSFTRPAILPLLLLMLAGALWMLALTTLVRRPTLAFVLTIFLISMAALGLALARGWAAALLPWATLAAALALLYAYRASLLGLLGKLVGRYSRGGALNYGLVALAAAWLAYVLIRAGLTLQPPEVKIFRDTFPDSLLLGLLGMGLLMLVLVLGREGLLRLTNALVRLAGSRRGASALLALFGAIWIGYEASIVAALPYVGHADYADNAVVARNLVAGRGWVVDYVTQFYKLYPSVTHAQETWPLLQPVWIAPFFALLGAQSWVAKIPNLIFIALLGVLVYAAGARLWDRRVGLTAAIVVLTSHLFFKLVIYTTTDLAFVVFSFGAIYLLYRATTDHRLPTTGYRPLGMRIEDRGSRSVDLRSSILDPRSSIRTLWWLLLGSGILTGLMMLQKPGSGVIIAGGMGLWLIAQTWRQNSPAQSKIQNPKSKIMPVVTWALVVLLILSPYVVRNIELFGAPFYSTESRDAWVQAYGQDWEIYKVYTPEADLSETGGLPDATWVLRWGFDRTLRKIGDQVVSMRDYLLPPWRGLPLNLSEVLFGRPDKAPLLFGMGAWLLLLGALGALRARPRLLSLLLAAFLPYSAFLMLYWHADEERYFVMLMPWLALLAAYTIWRAYARIAAIGDGRWAPIGLALTATALVLIVTPSWPIISEKVQAEPQRYAADIEAYTWLGEWARAHQEPDAVVMTRNPWQFNWHSRLPALMVPHTTSPETFLRLAHYYQVRYLVLDSLQRPPVQVRNMLDALIKNKTLEHLYTTPVHRALNPEGQPITMTTEIYRFPADYGGVAAARP
jgi:4-amino-4-deoxy-L-arabinose transferase-like glycosyltransferase